MILYLMDIINFGNEAEKKGVSGQSFLTKQSL